MSEFVAHRGLYNMDYPENSPDAILNTLNRGYDVEVDIRYHEKRFYMGHDTPDYLLPLDVLLASQQNKTTVYFHAKDALTYFKFERILATELNNFNYLDLFYHTTEDFVMTAKHKAWIHPSFSGLDFSATSNLKTIKVITNKDGLEKEFRNYTTCVLCVDDVANAVEAKIAWWKTEEAKRKRQPVMGMVPYIPEIIQNRSSDR